MGQRARVFSGENVRRSGALHLGEIHARTTHVASNYPPCRMPFDLIFDKAGKSVRPKSVTHVTGTKCYPCLRAEPPIKVARPERFELPTLWFEARCSIQLSYGRVRQF